MFSSQVNRRTFLKIGALSSLAIPAVGMGAPSTTKSGNGPRSLSFLNLHTDERLNAVYWTDGDYVPESLADINRILRDYRSGDICDIDRRLLDTLHRLRTMLDTTEPLQLISGYRSPKTNSMLRKQGRGVAENSLHTKGMAADIRIPGRSLSVLRQAAISLQAGGVGYYPASAFVHIDTGRIRTW